MESSVAIQLFNEASLQGMRFSTYVGDEDSTTDSRLKALVEYEIEKWTDVNHSKRTLGSRLYSVKETVKGLNSTVITYIQKCFVCAIKQHANDPTGMKNNLQLIAPHVFGDHSGCQGAKWCKFDHSDLPDGRNLQGEDLRSAIEDAIRPFLRDYVISKLIHVGSTQGTESLNGVIGFKTPKIRHYGGSESVDFRTAAGVAQFNDGSFYITDVCEELNLVSYSVTANHVDKLDKRRRSDRVRKSTRTFKKRRNQLKKTKHQKTSSQERHEGVTYQSEVGLTSIQDAVEVTKETLTLLNETITEEQFNSYVGKLAAVLHGIDIPSDRDRLSEASQSRDVSFVIIDLETTGLDRSAEIIQLSCKSVQYQSFFNTYLLPETRKIKEAASKVHGISVQYKDGQKVLQKEGKTLPAVEQQSGLQGFIDYLNGIEQASGRRVALVAHNGLSFDFPVLFKSLERHGLMETFGEIKLLFVDSLKIIAEEVKRSSRSVIFMFVKVSWCGIWIPVWRDVWGSWCNRRHRSIVPNSYENRSGQKQGRPPWYYFAVYDKTNTTIWKNFRYENNFWQTADNRFNEEKNGRSRTRIWRLKEIEGERRGDSSPCNPFTAKEILRNQ